ncbi:hypothetical protein C0Z16_25100 [Paraburkholderia rhynchosiae]|uniref:Uncharacterized protein n=1 Tax=Paraburkholderia rhynchosiae TaxID=487049 RepID=A0ABX4UYX8_9BURK|nr:hypothetical protein C0Z16_25100 [Paraburkholderia rhynchosiae]
MARDRDDFELVIANIGEHKSSAAAPWVGACFCPDMKVMQARLSQYMVFFAATFLSRYLGHREAQGVDEAG